MRAAIIAGGIGSRITSLANNLPKTLLPIAGKPLLSYQLDLLLSHNIKDIIILAGYKHEKIEEYIKSKPDYEKTVQILHEPEAAGSGGCLHYLPFYDSSSLVLFGDIFLSMKLDPFFHLHQTKQSLVSIILQTNEHPMESDLIKITEENKCIDLTCKPHNDSSNLEGHMVAGVFLCEPSFLRDIPSGMPLDLVHDLIAPRIKQGLPIFGYYTKEYLNDIGTPERYERVQREWAIMSEHASTFNSVRVA